MNKLNVEATKIFCSILKKLGSQTRLRLQASNMMDLVVEKLQDQIETVWGDGTMYSLAHYYKKEGDPMRDPEMEFIVVDNRDDDKDYLLIGIYPKMYQQDDLGLYEESVTIEEGKVTSFIKPWQLAHCRFANKWMLDIRSHGYLK